MRIHLGMDIYRRKIIRSSRPQGGVLGVLWVKNAKIWISYQTAGSIGTNFGTHVKIHLEMVMGEIKITPCLGGIWGVLGVRK